MRRVTDTLLARSIPGKQRPHGQAMIEYLIILPVLLMLVLGAVQFALLYQIKSTLNYATFIAARQGAVSNAKSNSIKDGLASGMTPLFTFEPDLAGLLRGRAIAMVEVFNPLTAKVEVLNPTKDAMEDFGIDNPDGSGGKIIPNDNLMYRCTGTPCVADVGAKSGITIQDANLLKIRVTYCAKLIVPMANFTIYSLVNGITGTQNFVSEFFKTKPSLAATPNMCSTLKDQFGGKAASVEAALNSITGVMGVSTDFSFVTNALNEISSKLNSATIPGIDWGIGGYRIPITAEAVVRMQSPVKS